MFRSPLKGDELLIQVHEKYPGTVKVMLTGQADHDAIERTRRQANLHCCLYKPWQEEELIDTLVSGLNIAGQNSEVSRNLYKSDCIVKTRSLQEKRSEEAMNV
ncbi:MAG: hypothetical protein RBT80_05250 [Candidatus Vecturithrix sp.]|nr:hypothetical protein [Candidatus Vecturithrix sp.]